MQELEKILKEMKKIKDGNRKENLYAKYPPNDEQGKILNGYSQGYEDGTDNFYNMMVEIIRKHMNDGWILVERELPESKVLACDKYGEITIGYITGSALEGYQCESDEYTMYHVIAWRPLPEPYSPERNKK